MPPIRRIRATREFPPADPVFDFGGWLVSVQVITFENLYGLDPALVTREESATGWRVHAAGLTWGGGQERCPGTVELLVDRLPDGEGLLTCLSATHAQTIRCVKLLVSGLPDGTLLGRGWGEQAIPNDGLVYEYPGGPQPGGANTQTLQMPLIFLQPTGEDKFIAFRSLDDQVRAKRFAIARRDGAVTVELIHEEAAHRMGVAVVVPPWRIERTTDPAATVRAQVTHAATVFGLQAWESRPDVPDWARRIALVAAPHGMHWSGYVFNTYAQMAAALHWITTRIEGQRVLAYLPGWEGRYYWQYGNFRPDPRLGGEEGFRQLTREAHALGVHLMPMFAAHSANSASPNFAQWGEPARLRTAAGFIEQGNKPNWDIARAHDPAWQAILNPGAPTWRAELIRQVRALLDAYDLGADALFFDTSHWWQNDPTHPVYEGLVALRDELNTLYPELLICGEGWYDALGAVTPVSHAHVPARWAEEAFTPHNRGFAHLSTGDPSRGSTGVHERGASPFEAAPLARHYWPTVTIVDGTIERAPEGVEAVIAQTHAYIARFLTP